MRQYKISLCNSDNLPYEKVGKNEPVCIADEVPFDIPDSWEIIRLNDIGIYKKGPFGSSLTKSLFVSKSSDAVKVYEQKNAIQKDHKLGNYYITKEYYQNKMQGFTVNPGDILVSCAGTIGETYIMPNDIELGIINQALMKMTIFAPINIDYFLLYFDYVLKQSAQETSKGSAIKNIPPFEIFKRLILPLPPLSEQQRIVEKIEELLPLVEEYDKVEKQNKELNISFPEKLKKSILQEAVQGKLVPQDPNDEPASVLIDRIRKEKEQLIKDKKIKKDKNESYIFRRDNSYYEKLDGKETCIDDLLPFDIPESWEWVRLRSICTKLVDGDHNPPKGENKQTEYIMASSTNINNDTIVELEKVRYLSQEIFNKENERTNATVGDIFFTSVGSLGRSCVYTGGLNICFQRSVSVISTLVFNQYLKRFFDSAYFQQKVTNEATGTAQKGFYLNQLSNCLIAISPLKEQKRIVLKLEELLPQIERLTK